MKKQALRDLYKGEISLNDYRVIVYAIERFEDDDNFKFKCFIDEVMKWFKKQKFKISNVGVNYIIEL